MPTPHLPPDDPGPEPFDDMIAAGDRLLSHLAMAAVFAIGIALGWWLGHQTL